jgi:ParB-like chromosome segregation protein Spo0J
MGEKLLMEDWSFQPISVGEPFTLAAENLDIDVMLRTFLSPLTEQEELQLDENIRKVGCLDPLLVWRRDMNRWVLVDGHYRYLICKKHGLPFQVREVHFEQEAQVKAFMIEQQLGRRNLTPSQLHYFRGIKYNSIVNLSRQKKDEILDEREKREKTCDYLAKKFSISRSTILRDAEFAKGMEVIGRVNKRLKENILMGSEKIARKDVQTLAQLNDIRKLGKVQNIGDIKIKLERIRAQENKDVLEMHKRLEREKEFNAINAAIKHAFLDTDAKLNDLKGKVLSCMKNGIEQRSVRPIKKAIKILEEMEGIILMDGK